MAPDNKSDDAQRFSVNLAGVQFDATMRAMGFGDGSPDDPAGDPRYSAGEALCVLGVALEHVVDMSPVGQEKVATAIRLVQEAIREPSIKPGEVER